MVDFLILNVLCNCFHLRKRIGESAVSFLPLKEEGVNFCLFIHSDDSPFTSLIKSERD